MPETKSEEASLLLRAADGDEEASDELLKRYKSLVIARASRYYLQGGERDDLIQEGMIGLFKALQSFDPEKSAQFGAFAGHCVESRLKDAVKAAARQRHQPLNRSLSLEQSLAGAEERQATLLGDTIGATNADPEEQFLSLEAARELHAYLSRELSAMEARVLDRFSSGASYREIAKAMSISEKSVEGALRRARKKGKKFFRKEDSAGEKE